MSEGSLVQRWLAQDASHLARAAAQLLLETVADAVAQRGQAIVAVSGGSTPKKLFETLADDYFRARVPWSQLHLFWVDERCVPPQHPDSNYGMTKTALLSKVPIPESHIHRFHGETTPPLDAAKAYESELKAFFKVEKSLPIFDAVLLGVGEDGHTASLFPNSSALEENVRWAAAPFVDKVSAHRLTLTLPVLNSARRTIVLASGAGKASVIREIWTAEGRAHFPIQFIRPAGEVVWIIDHPAASKLPDEARFQLRHLDVPLA